MQLIMGKAKAGIRLAAFGELEFVPRFEYGEMAQLAEVCGERDGTELGTGWCRLTAARIPWTIHYDEVLTVIEGNLRLHANGETYELGERDSIWLPAATALIYEAESALLFYSVHPAKWPAD